MAYNRSPEAGTGAPNEPGSHQTEEYQYADPDPTIMSWEVSAQHEKKQSNDDESIVFGAHFRAKRIGLVRFAVCREGRHHAALSGQDAHPDVGGHDRSQHRSQLQAGGAAGEKLKQPVGGCRDQRATNNHADVAVRMSLR